LYRGNAVLSDVRARIRVRDEAVTAEQDVQEVGGGRVVLVPARVAELDLVLRVLAERILDVHRKELRRRLVAEAVQQPDEVLAKSLVDVGRVRVHLDPSAL